MGNPVEGAGPTEAEAVAAFVAAVEKKIANRQRLSNLAVAQAKIAKITSTPRPSRPIVDTLKPEATKSTPPLQEQKPAPVKRRRRMTEAKLARNRARRVQQFREIEIDCPACKVKLRACDSIRKKKTITMVWCRNFYGKNCQHRNGFTWGETEAKAIANWLRLPTGPETEPSRPKVKTKYDRTDVPVCKKCHLRIFEGETHRCTGRALDYGRSGLTTGGQ